MTIEPFNPIGLAMVSMAFQRFILVKMPFKAQAILTEAYYKTVCFAMIVIPMTLIFAAIGRTLIENQLYGDVFDCDGRSFYGDRRVRGIADGIIFVLVPALICTVMYLSVAIELWKRQANRKRNRQLSILFMLSCLAWIVLCLPLKIIDIYQGGLHIKFNEATLPKFFQLSRANFLAPILIQVLYPLFSTINPLIFIACCVPTQQPMKIVIQKIFKKREQNAGDPGRNVNCSREVTPL